MRGNEHTKRRMLSGKMDEAEMSEYNSGLTNEENGELNSPEREAKRLNTFCGGKSHKKMTYASVCHFFLFFRKITYEYQAL